MHGTGPAFVRRGQGRRMRGHRHHRLPRHGSGKLVDQGSKGRGAGVMTREIFEFKEFSMCQGRSGQRINTDSCAFGDIVDADSPRQVIDIGCGSGVLALMMAKKFPEAHVHAVEFNKDVAAIAAENFSNCPWSGRIFLHQSSAQEFARVTPERFDLIVCNPPFFTGSTRSSNPERAMARHDDALPPMSLASVIQNILAPQGYVWILAAAGDETKWIDALQGRLTLTENCELADNPRAIPHAVALCFTALGERRLEGVHLPGRHATFGGFQGIGQRQQLPGNPNA
ncbi:methyltransferase domain-containing protein, partial [bacterium]|nr:methyltransferase domain-containing protein [bacterium]